MRCYNNLVRHEGNLALFTAVEISIVSTLAGRPLHVHAEGVRGTGKTTIMRSATSILPPIERIKGCPHNCRPTAPHCPEHRGGDSFDTELVAMPFLEISHSAKLGTVIGSIDLARVVGQASPEAAMLVGTIPRANRGILFVDEVNRLADTSPELTDVLLDTMGTKPGRVQIEESGLPVLTLPVECSVWAASNPDEEPGPLEDVRRQLSDRFDLCVEIGRTHESAMIRQILDVADFALASGAVGAAVGAAFGAVAGSMAGAALRGPGSLGLPDLDGPSDGGAVGRRLATAAMLAPVVKFPDEILDCLASLYVDFDIESIRAMESVRTAARCRAALTGRTAVSFSDLKAVMPMALRHRVEVAQAAGVLRMLDTMADRFPEPRDSVAALMAKAGGARAARSSGAVAGSAGAGAGAGPEAGQSAGGAAQQARDGRAGHSAAGADDGGAAGAGGDYAADAGLRAMLRGLLDRVRPDCTPGGAARAGRDTTPRSGTSQRRGQLRGQPQLQRPNRPAPQSDYDRGQAHGRDQDQRQAGDQARQSQEQPMPQAVCPETRAVPIDEVVPKAVFGEEDLA